MTTQLVGCSRYRRTRILRLALLVASIVVACDQRTPGPSMAETESWFQNEFPSLARNYSIERDDRNSKTTSVSTSVTSASLTDCVLTYVWTFEHTMTGPGIQLPANQTQDTTAVRLADIDLKTLELRRLIHLPGYKPDWDEYEVFFTTRKRDGTGTEPRSPTGNDNGGFRVSSHRAGERILNALTHAARLCGARGSAF